MGKYISHTIAFVSV